MNKISENIQSLKEAQELDSQIYEAKLILEEIPKKKAQLNEELELEKTALADLETASKNMHLKLKEKELKLSDKEEQVKKFDGQLSQVKTNKEYSALQQEISSLKADNSILEEEILHVLDEVDAAKEETAKEKHKLDEISKAYGIKEKELATEETNHRAVLENALQKRKEVIAKLPADVSDLYNRIIEKKHGLALVSVVGDTCGACQMQLRPQLLNDIRLGENIVTCENCSRILYFEE